MRFRVGVMQGLCGGIDLAGYEASNAKVSGQ